MGKTIRANRIYANKGSFGRGVELYLCNQDSERTALFTQANFVMVEDDGMIHEPTMLLDNKTAQALMDALWSCGIRPNNGEGMDAQVTAIRYHLEDMRRLVFKDDKNNG